MPKSKKLSTFVINKVESDSVYTYMKDNDLLNDDELYLTPDTSSEISDEQITSAVEAYLESHPELTSTVTNGSITSDKLSQELASDLGIEQHVITEVSIPLIEYAYGQWTPAAGGTNNGIAPILTPQKFRFTNPSKDKDVTISSTLIQFLNEEDPETATIYESGKINELKQWVIPAGQTVEFDTYEYGRTPAKYIRFRWTNWPRVLLDVTAIYDSYKPVAPKLDTESDYLKDFPTKWMLQAINASLTYRQGFCIVPFYPDTDYYLYISETTQGATPTVRPIIYGLPDDSFLTVQDKYIGVSQGTNVNCNVRVYKNTYDNIATTENTVAGADYLKITTKSWDETIGCKYLAIAMGKYGQEMRYSAAVGEVLDAVTIKNFFDEKDSTMPTRPFVSRFDMKIDRSIYAQIVIANPNLPDDGGTKSLAMAKMGAGPLNNAKWTLFGDSLTDNYGGHDLLSNYFASKIAKEFGMELDNRAKSGSNIYRGGSGNYVNVSGMIKLDEFVAELEAGTIEQPDYITIAFGTNSFTTDLGTNDDTADTDTSVYGATKRFIETLREKCPNSVFGFVLSPKQNWGSSDPQNKRAVDAARAAIKTVCDSYGVPYIDMSTQSGITVDMLPDGIHISNTQSQNLYYHAMRRFMIGL